MGGAGVIMVSADEEAVVEGVPEREGETISGNVGLTAGAVGIISGRGPETVGVCGGKGVVEEELDACAQEAA